MSITLSSRSTFENQDILVQLDQCFLNYHFPMLDHGHVHLAATHMHGYRDDNRWVLLIERLGYNNRGGGHNGIENALFFFGNCLDFYPGELKGNKLFPCSDSSQGATFDQLYQEYLHPKVNSIRVRDREISFPKDPEAYQEAGVPISDPRRIHASELLRWLIIEHLNELMAKQEEIRQRIPADIPHVFTLHEWKHPRVANREKPSDSQTFQLLSQALASGDLDLLEFTERPNTHWSNWPLGGSL